MMPKSKFQSDFTLGAKPQWRGKSEFFKETWIFSGNFITVELFRKGLWFFTKNILLAFSSEVRKNSLITVSEEDMAEMKMSTLWSRWVGLPKLRFPPRYPYVSTPNEWIVPYIGGKCPNKMVFIISHESVKNISTFRKLQEKILISLKNSFFSWLGGFASLTLSPIIHHDCSIVFRIIWLVENEHFRSLPRHYALT